MTERACTYMGEDRYGRKLFIRPSVDGGYLIGDEQVEHPNRPTHIYAWDNHIWVDVVEADCCAVLPIEHLPLLIEALTRVLAETTTPA